MESVQFHISTRMNTILDTQKRSVIQVSLGRDVVDIPDDIQCSVSVISAEILNNIYSVESTTNQTVYVTNSNVITPTSFLSLNVAACASNRLALSNQDYDTFSALPKNTPLIFSGYLVSQTAVTSNVTYFLASNYPTSMQFSISSIRNGALIANFPNRASTNLIVNSGLKTTLQIPSAYHTPSTLAAAINSKPLVYNGGILSCSNSADNLLTLGVSNSNYLYFPTDIPEIGLYTKNMKTNITSNVTLTSSPYLQKKFLQISSSFSTTRNQPLCKVPINAGFGSFIQYAPQVPFQVDIHDDMIGTFQVSLLDEDSNPINNNYADWSLTLQFDFRKKPKDTIDNE